MHLPGDLLERPAGESARLIVLALLSQAHRVAKRLDDPDDLEALHDFRVAIRRIRAALESWSDRLPKKTKALKKALTRIQRSTGAARDAEVALEWLADERGEAGPEVARAIDWLCARLETERTAAMDLASIRSSFEETRAALLARARIMEYDLLAQGPGATFAEEVAQRARARFVDLAQLLTSIAGPEDAARMHRARIAGKRLRYLIEPVLDLDPLAVEAIKRLRKLQDLLGELHDAHVLTDRIALMRIEVDEFELRTSIDSVHARSAARAVALHRRVVDRWIGGGLESLREAVDRLAEALSVHKNVEVERKYLLSGMPELRPDAPSLEVDQGYLPGGRLRERVRRVQRDGEFQYYRTIKLGTGVERMEIEEETTKEVFETLWSLTEGCRVRKRRYFVEEGGLTWEIDQFLDRDLVLAEVELPSAKVRPPIPEWLAPKMVEDVTERGDYTNLALAR